MFVVVWVECLLGYQLVAVINLKAFFKIKLCPKNHFAKKVYLTKFLFYCQAKKVYLHKAG